MHCANEEKPPSPSMPCKNMPCRLTCGRVWKGRLAQANSKWTRQKPRASKNSSGCSEIRHLFLVPLPPLCLTQMERAYPRHPLTCIGVHTVRYGLSVRQPATLSETRCKRKARRNAHFLGWFQSNPSVFWTVAWHWLNAPTVQGRARWNHARESSGFHLTRNAKPVPRIQSND